VWDSGVSVELWNADMPEFVLCASHKVNRIPKPIVWSYYTFRKIYDRIVFGKNGRNNACLL
jgi:hypothetical protein